jgi:poly-beta-1,6-N-acetyl-D-glucosamine synthase
MTGVVLTAIVLGGLSCVLWGCVGWMRLVQDVPAGGRRALALVPATLLASIAGLLLLELTAGPLLGLADALAGWTDLTATTTVQLAAVVALLWVPLCGLAAAYLVARLFGACHAALAALAFGGGYAVLVAAGGHEALAPAIPSSLPTLAWVAMFGMAINAAGLGVVLARRADPPPRPALADPAPRRRLEPRDVAVLVPAHDEEQSLPICLEALAAMVPRENIFVGSDGSTDGTVRVARAWGCQVLDIQPNVGKARALQQLVDQFAICERFEVVLIADADAQPDPSYLAHALPLFDDPEVVAVAGHAIPRWCQHWIPRWSMFFAAYRTRLYRVLQALLRYGQTWRHANVTYIVPGFSSMYRTRVLPHLDLSAPGLAVEDFNMTFAIHRHRLGRIAYTPRARSISQEAYWFRDYWKQVTRWYLGFWQTVRLHGVWASAFWLWLGVLIVEMFVQSIVFVALPLVLLWFASHGGAPLGLGLPLLGELRITALDVAIGVFVADYALTAIVAVTDRKPILLVYGFGFVVLRWVDSLLFLATLPRAFFTSSDGRWVSPRRI